MFFVRTASERDLKKVRDLLGETWRATYADRYGAEKVATFHDTRHSLSALKVYLDQPSGEFLVADNGSEIAGMAYAAPAKDMAKTINLYMLYVHPEHQRQGIGRDLFAEVESCFPDAEIMRLDVDQDNAGAIAFYAAHGFEEVGRIQADGDDAEPGLPALILEKPLEAH